MTGSSPNPPRPFTGRHMLLVTMTGFLVVIAVNVTMAYLATHSFPGIVVENSYVASQNYNALIESGRRQAATGVVADLSASGGRLRVMLADRDGAALAGLAVSALAGRPSTTRDDRTIAFVEDGGAYLSAVALPDGIWEVDIEAYRGTELVFRRTSELIVGRSAATHVR